MSKRNNLKDFLTDLYEGIAKKKPNASHILLHLKSKTIRIKE